MPREPKLHDLTIPRTARYATIGPASAEECWYVLHGYGELASAFAARFSILDDGRRLIVAPEALSRFYVGRDPERVGACWMTREARATEIADYVNYLDQVAARIRRDGGGATRTVVLGYSQGTATASRWVSLGRVRPDRLVLWGGTLAHDLDLDRPDHPLRSIPMTLVIGQEDHYATPERVRSETERLDRVGLRWSTVAYEGGHRMDESVLETLPARLWATPP